MSGLKVNFHKSELYCFGDVVNKQMDYSRILTCKIGYLPLTYLGIPVSKTRLRNIHRKNIEDTMECKLGCWQGKLLSIEGRLIIVSYCLSNISLYMLSFYKLPKG